MKPILIPINEKGEPKLTKQELEKIIDDAYTQGLSDGGNVTVYPYYPYYPVTYGARKWTNTGGTMRVY